MKEVCDLVKTMLQAILCSDPGPIYTLAKVGYFWEIATPSFRVSICSLWWSRAKADKITKVTHLLASSANVFPSYWNNFYI